MKTDVYTKVILTGILACLCLLLLRDVRFETPEATAQENEYGYGGGDYGDRDFIGVDPNRGPRVPRAEAAQKQGQQLRGVQDVRIVGWPARQTLRVSGTIDVPEH